jgi:hypothetical protein
MNSNLLIDVHGYRINGHLVRVVRVERGEPAANTGPVLVKDGWEGSGGNRAYKLTGYGAI